MPVNDVKRAGPNPHLVLTWVCMFSKTLLFATLLSLFQKQLHHKSSDNPQSHPGSTSWSSCLSPIASWVHHRSQHLPALLWVLPAVLFSVQQQKCLHVPGTKQSYKSHPQCQGWLSESPLTAHTCVCPATNTCLLTLMTRNLVSPGDGGEYTNKMLQVL